MRILVTGASGLVGSNIIEHSAIRKHEFLTPTSAELNLLVNESVRDYLCNHKPDMIIHAAGKVGGIQANIREPASFLTANLLMAVNILTAARSFNIKRVLNIASSCMYPRGITTTISEEALLSGALETTNEGYALAKIISTRLGQYINQEAGCCAFKTIVPCNIYGRHDSFSPLKSHLVPAAIHKIHEAMAINSQIVQIWGHGSCRREFMYAADLADCIHRCIDKFETLPELMNVGLGRDWSVLEYYQVAARVMGYNGTFQFDTTKPIGMQRKLLSIDKQMRWGWVANTPLETGVALTYDYYLSHLKS